MPPSPPRGGSAARAYGKTAGLVAAAAIAVETIGVAYSHMAVTDVPMTALIAVSLAFAVRGRLELAGLAAGLAASAKYPAVFLVVPLVVAAWGKWRRLGYSLGIAVVAFLATSPYVLVHPHLAWADASRVQRLAREGWLGFEHDSWALFSFTGKLWDGFGPALVIGVIGLALALYRRTRTDLILASFVLAYLVDLLTIRAHFDRYVLPLVPALGGARGQATDPCADHARLPDRPARLDYRRRRTPDAHRHARRRAAWIVRSVPPHARIAAESSTPPLAGHPIVGLALPGPGRPFDPDRDVAQLRAQGVRYALVTGAIADRVLAARDSIPQRGSVLRRAANPREAGLPCGSGARTDRALGLRLPAMREDAAPASPCRARPRRLRRRLLRDQVAQKATRSCAEALAGELATVGEQDRRVRLLPELDPRSADGPDRRPLEQHRLRLEGSQLPRSASSGRRAAERDHINLRGYPGRDEDPELPQHRARRRQEARHVRFRASPTRRARRRSPASA